MMWDLVNSPTPRDGATSAGSTCLGGGGAASPPELLRRVDAELPRRGIEHGLRPDRDVVGDVVDLG